VIKIYCEHSALSKQLREFQRQGRIELVHFPYDPDSRSRYLRQIAVPSAAQIRDLNLPYRDLPGTFEDYAGSPLLEAILRIIGQQNRRDALHLDSAHKSDCTAFVTVDSDILGYRAELGELLGMYLFHPVADEGALAEFVGRAE